MKDIILIQIFIFLIIKKKINEKSDKLDYILILALINIKYVFFYLYIKMKQNI